MGKSTWERILNVFTACVWRDLILFKKLVMWPDVDIRIEKAFDSK